MYNLIAVLHLNFLGKMMVDLFDIVEDLNKWESGKAVIVRGAGETFCSGGDLQVMKGLVKESDGGTLMCDFMQHTLTSLFQSRLLSVALIEGYAVGGGAEIATACDFRLATSNAKIGFVHSRMGLTPGWGGASRLVRIVGRTGALRLLASAAVLDAQDAMGIKLVDGIVSTESAITECTSWLSTLINCEPVVAHALKRVVVGAVDSDLTSSLHSERQIFATLFGGEAQQNAHKRQIKHR